MRVHCSVINYLLTKLSANLPFLCLKFLNIRQFFKKHFHIMYTQFHIIRKTKLLLQKTNSYLLWKFFKRDELVSLPGPFYLFFKSHSSKPHFTFKKIQSKKIVQEQNLINHFLFISKIQLFRIVLRLSCNYLIIIILITILIIYLFRKFTHTQS